MESAVADRAKRYTDVSELPESSAKYFHQRYDLFSRYDDGVLMTPEAFYEVTPEAVATKISTHITEKVTEGKTTIIDCFAGVGGNTIAFAKNPQVERVFAVEQDEAKIACLRHNLKLHGLEGKVMVSPGDVFSVLRRFRSLRNQAIIFASPPWGGPGYATDQIFDLSRMEPYNLKTLYDAMSNITPHVVLYLPRNSDLDQIAALNKTDYKIHAIHYCLKGASKAMCVYYGEWKELHLRDATENTTTGDHHGPDVLQHNDHSGPDFEQLRKILAELTWY